MHFSPARAKGDISTLPAGGHFYFALTDIGLKLTKPAALWASVPFLDRILTQPRQCRVIIESLWAAGVENYSSCSS